MSRFKPQVSYLTANSLRNWLNSSQYTKPRVSKYITKQFNTYAELKKELPEICKDDISDEGVCVVRSKRGQWGEWWEHWKYIDNRPTIVKEGWA